MLAMVAVLSSLVAVNIYLYQQHYQKTHFDCQGNRTVRNGNHTLKARVFLTLDGDIGQAVIEGKVTDKEGNIAFLHRVFVFNFKQSGDDIYMTNYSVAEFANDTIDEETLKTLLPSFLFTNDLSTKTDILYISDAGLLITNAKLMILYCKK